MQYTVIDNIKLEKVKALRSDGGTVASLVLHARPQKY